MTKHFTLETRSEPDDDQMNEAVQAVQDLRTASQEFETRLDERVSTEVRTITDRLDQLETRLQRPGPGGGNQDEATEIERRAFTGFLRGGREILTPEEVRSLRVSDDTAGGYLAPAEFIAEVIKGITEVSPVRQAARVGNTSSGSVLLPKRTGKPTASWVGETESSSETGSTYGQAEIPVHEAKCHVDVSNRLLEDSAVNVESEVAMDLSEEFGRLEGAAFVNGDGVKKPLGFMNASGVGETLNGHATTLAADPLITLMYALPAFYRNSGVWMCNGTTLGVIRKLKDGQNNYLWQPSYQAGQPETILGRPVIEAPDMPDIESGSYPIVFGDFGRAYRIFDRLLLSIMRDPYSVATSGLVRFHARRRTGGGVTLGEALRKLKMATS